jgi:hypothetical protein
LARRKGGKAAFQSSLVFASAKPPAQPGSGAATEPVNVDLHGLSRPFANQAEPLTFILTAIEPNSCIKKV